MLLQDYSYERPIFMGSWHILLPSDVNLDCIFLGWRCGDLDWWFFLFVSLGT